MPDHSACLSDQALRQAKRTGRDRIVVAGGGRENEIAQEIPRPRAAVFNRR